MAHFRQGQKNKHYNYFRDYDPAVGRYVESDPIGLIAGTNTFGYVAGNPLGLYDDKGLISPAVVYIGVAGYFVYELWDRLDKQRSCEALCPIRCNNIRACGDPERNYMYEASSSRCIVSCKSRCFGESWWGVGGRGPMAPTPPDLVGRK
jgi:RHS repeat-associated protein